MIGRVGTIVRRGARQHRQHERLAQLPRRAGGDGARARRRARRTRRSSGCAGWTASTRCARSTSTAPDRAQARVARTTTVTYGIVNVARPRRSGCSSASRPIAARARSRSGRRQHGDAARRRGPFDEAGTVERLGVRELLALDIGEAPDGAAAPRRAGATGRARRRRRRRAAVRSATHGTALIAQVPEQAEHAAGHEHARDLPQRPIRLEPVERLGRRAPRRRCRRAERDRLGRTRRAPAGRGACARAVRACSAAARRRSPRRPAATSTWVSFPVPAARSTTRRPGARSSTQLDRLGGVRRPRPLIGVGHPVERSRRLGRRRRTSAAWYW